MSKGWIRVEGQVWNKNTCETRRCNHQIRPGNRDVDYILKDIEFAVRTVDEKLKKEGTSDPEIEISFSKGDLENCLGAVKKQGQQEAWDLARRIIGIDSDTYSYDEVYDVFVTDVIDTKSFGQILNMPVEEVLAKDKKHQEEKEALHIGDEVEFIGSNPNYKVKVNELMTGYVIGFEGECNVRILAKHGLYLKPHEMCEKTGKHNLDVEKVMASFEKGEKDD